MVGRMSRRVWSLRKAGRKIRRVSKRGGKRMSKRIKRRTVRRTRSLRKGSKKNGRRMRSLRKGRTRISRKIRGGAGETVCEDIYELKETEPTLNFAQDFLNSGHPVGTYKIIQNNKGEYRVIAIVKDEKGQIKYEIYKMLSKTNPDGNRTTNFISYLNKNIPSESKDKVYLSYKDTHRTSNEAFNLRSINYIKTQLEKAYKNKIMIKFNDNTIVFPQCVLSEPLYRPVYEQVGQQDEETYYDADSAPSAKEVPIYATPID
jgi:hypothetical protein